MKFSSLGKLKHLVREGREVLRRTISRSVGAGPLSLPGQFQTYNYTLPHRYPWLFQFADAGARFYNLGAPVEDIGQSLEKLEFLFRIGCPASRQGCRMADATQQGKKRCVG